VVQWPGNVQRVQAGDEVYRQRLSLVVSGFSASPVAADGKIYLSNEDGEMLVIAAGEKFSQIATNSYGRVPHGNAGIVRFSDVRTDRRKPLRNRKALISGRSGGRLVSRLRRASARETSAIGEDQLRAFPQRCGVFTVPRL
jgi:hypothetical protein